MSIRWRLVAYSIALTLFASPAIYAQRAVRSAPPVPVKLQTKDGVDLSITYYASSLGKDATPIVLLHDNKDTQGMFSSLAGRLQSPGEEDKHASFAVVTVDLRGHGASTKQAAPDGTMRDIDAAKLNKEDVVLMSTLDMEAVRGFLVDKNDKEELNLNRLGLLGVGMGATVAVNWAAEDWSAPPLTVGKQGQDVKALVLISPRWKDHGVTVQDALKFTPFKQSIAWMLIYGSQDAAAMADAKRIYKQLDRLHPEPEPSKSAKPRDLVALGAPSALQGSSLFTQLGPKLEDQIIDFLSVHVTKQDLPWVKRRHTVQ